MNTHAPVPDRLLELLAARAVEPLPDAERAELQRLLAVHQGPDTDSLDRAAAALHLALNEPAGSLPAGLRAKLEAAASATLGAGVRPGADTPLQIAPVSRSALPARRGPSPVFAWTGWLAAAAAIALAAAAWWPTPAPVQPPTAAPTLADRRAALLNTAPDTVTAPWQPLAEAAAANASGDVVWSTARQEGYMRFSGFPVNDPAKERYQLWIFTDDPNAQAAPPSGGVFDIDPATGEAVVAIDPMIQIPKVVAFAVTREQPGGVVVSDRARIVALAAVKADGGG